MIALLLVGAGTAETADAQIVRPFTKRFSVNDNADVQLIGNTVETCPTGGTCAASQNGSNTSADNNNYNMIYVDVDADTTTFNSSSATFTLPAGATVAWAGLYWGGYLTAGTNGAAPVNSAARGTVEFQTPVSGYQTLTGSVDVTSDSAYSGFADVTTLVQAAGSGTYTVANVQASTGENMYGGWSLVVVYHDPSAATRNVTVFDGFGRVTGSPNVVNFTVTGFTTPLAGTVMTNVGVVAYEGDIGITGDYLQLNGTNLSDALNASTNFFNSRITRLGAYLTAKNPNYDNNLGIDIKLVAGNSILANGATSATLNASTNGDTYYPSTLVFETNLYAPDIAGQVIKTVTPVHGYPVHPGDTLSYNISVENVGQDGAINTVLTDTIPTGTTYVPGSLSVVSGANAGTKTDASGDDQGEYDAAGNRVIFQLGTGATATTGGLLAQNQSTAVSFRVRTNPGDNSGFTVSNQAVVTYNGQTLGTPYVNLSDSSTGGHNLPTKIQVTNPDLTITKSHGGGTLQQGGTGTYTLTVSNVGNYVTSGTITVADTLPTGVTATTAAGTGWTCAIAAGIVTCTRADALAAGATEPAISIAVSIAYTAPASITNAADVSGGAETNTANDRATDVATVTQEPDLSLTKSHTGTFTVGTTGTYTLTVTNSGLGATNGAVTVLDTLPAGLTFASDSGTGWTCSATGQVVTCTNAGPIAVNGTSTLLLRVSVGATAFPAVTNTAHASTPGDADPTHKTATDPTTITGAPDLSLAKTHTGTFTVGQPALYTIVLTNVGSAATTGTVTVVDTLPTGMTFVSDTGAGWTCAAVGQVVTCSSAAAIAPTGTSGIGFTLAVGAAAVPSVTNRAHVAATGDYNATNNVGTDGPTAVAGVVDLGVTLASSSPFIAGSPGTYTVGVTNVGSAATTGPITVTDTLPAGITYTSVAGTGWSCVAVGQVVTCSNAGPIAAGASDPLTLTVLVATQAVPAVTDTVRVATTGDVNPANNTASTTTTVNGTLDLAVTLASSSPFTVAQAGTYTIGVNNVGSTATTGAITLVDTLPVGISFTSVAGTGWTCAAVGRVVSCSNAGPIAAGASDPLTLTVAVAAAAVPSVTDTVRIATTGDANLTNNVASTTTVVNGVVDLALAKSHTGAFTVGTPGVYTLTVSNVGSAATTGAITLTDTLPTGLSYTSVAGTGWSCTATGQIVTCTDAGPIAAGANSVVTLTVAVAAAAIPTVTNTASVSTPGDVNPTNNKATDSPTTVNGAIDLAVTETSATPFTVGQAGTYTIGVSDVGSAATTGTITITDTLPAGITYTSVAGTGWSCAAVGQVVTCTNAGPIAVGASDPLTLTVAVGAAAVPGVTDTVRVATTGDVNLANNVASTTTVVNGVVDLAVTATSPAFTVGTPGTYTLGVSNVGSAATTGPITVTDTLPAGITYTSAAGTGWTCSAVGQVVTCTNAGPIAAGASDPVTLTVAVGATAVPSVTDTVRVTTTGDVNLANNVASTTTTVSGLIDLAVTLSSSTPFTVGIPGVYSIGVSNVGSGATTGPILITDTLPAGITLSGSFGTGWSCTAAGQVVTCTNAGPIAAGGSDPLTLDVDVAAAAVPSVTDTVRVATTGDVNPANNLASTTTVVNGVVDLALAKSHTGAFTVGTPGVYTLTVSNIGSAATTGAITIADTLPTGLSYTSGAGTGWTCAAVGQVVTCTDAGPIAARAQSVVTLTVAVAAAAIPTVTNTATVTTPGDVNPTNNKATDSPTTVNGTVDLAVTESSPAFTVGTAGTYTIGVTDVGSAATTGAITITDTLPAGITYTSVAGTGWSCAAVGQVVTCTNAGPIAAGASDPLTLTVAVAAAAVPSVTDTVRVATTGDVNLANNVATTTTTVNGVVDLAISATSASPFTVGTAGTYTFGVSNVGSAATTAAITLVDTLPAGITYTSVAGTGWSCVAVGQVVTCTNAGPIAAGASDPLTVTVAVAAAAVPGVTDTVRVATTGDVNLANNVANTTTVVKGVVDLALAKSHTGAFTVGQPGVYTLTVSNVGSAATTGAITIADTLPTGLSYTSVAGTGWSCTAAGQVVTCTDAGPIAAGAQSVVTLTVGVAAAAIPTVTNTASVSTPGDNDPGNNKAIDSPTTVNGTVDLAVTASSPAFTVGTAGTYTIGVTDVGSAATTGPITITDTLPAGITYTSAAGAGWTCVAVGQVVTCTNAGPIAAGASDPLTLTVGVGATAVPGVTDTVRVATTGDVNLANNTASVTTAVSGTIDLAVTATSYSPFTVGAAGTYTFGVSNVGSAATTGAITVTDTLPTGISYTSAAGTGWTCSAVGKVVTCTNAGPIAAGASDPLTLTVAVAASAIPGVTDTVRVATTGDVNLANNTASTTTTVDGVLDLAVSASSPAFTVGQPGTYTIGVSNVGSTATTGPITVTDTLPAGITYASVAGSGWSCSSAGQVVTCTNAGPIAAGGSDPLTLTVAVAAAAVPSVTDTVRVATAGDANAANNTASVTTAVNGVLDLAISASSSAFTVGSAGTYTFGITNVGSSATTSAITVTDTLPAGITYTSAAGTGWSCAAAGQVVTCTNAGPIAAGASDPLSLTVAVAAAAIPGVTDTVRIATAGDVNPANNVASVTTTVAGTVDLAVTESSPEFTVGTAGTYTIGVSDLGSAATTGAITLTDTLPAGITYTSAAGAGWTCVAVGQVVTCTNAGPIAAGASDPVTLTVAVAAAAVPSVTDTVRVATTGDVNLANNTASVTTTVNGVVDLALAKSHTGAFTVGTPGVYTLTVSNVGSAATTGAITIADTLPTGLSYASVTGTGWSCTAAGQVVSCTDAGPIAAGAQSVVTLTVGVTAGAIPTVTNTASVTTPGDVNPTNNKATDSPTTVNGTVDLAVTAASSSPFTVGQPGTYTIGVSDIGSAPTTGAITLTDTLPAGITYTSVAGTGWSCVAVGQVVTCTNAGPIAAGASDPLTLTVAVAAAAVPGVTDTVRVATTGDVNLANNVASTTTVVNGVVDLALAKSHSGAFTVGQPGVYTLTVSNIGSAATTGAIAIADTLPTGLSYTSVAGTGWSCTDVGQVVTCTDAGPIAAGAQSVVTLTVGVAAAAIPTVTNTASVTTPGDVNPTNNKATDSPTTVNGTVDLAVTAASPAPFTVGQPGTYTIGVSDVGSAATTGPITITDTLPAGITYTSVAGTGWSCAAVGQVVTCTNAGPIAAGASDPLTLTVAVGAAAVPSVTDTVRIATTGDVNLANNTASTTTAVNGAIDLAISATSSPSFTVGTAGTYTFAVSNVGSLPTTGASTITDTLPTGITYTSAAGTGWTCAAVGRVVTCTHAGSIAAGANDPVTLTVAVAAAAVPSVTDTVRVATTGDADLSNNTAAVTTTVAGTIDLAVSATSSTPFTVGTAGTYTFGVSNVGSGATTGAITITDTLPTGIGYTSVAGAGWSCAAVGQVVTCTNAGPLAAGASDPLTLTVAVAASAVPQVTDTVRVATTGDVNLANNTASTTTTVEGAIDLAVSATSSASFTVGQAGTYTFGVSNIGSTATTGATTLTDTLPTGVTYTSAAGTGWTCAAVGQVVTCTHAAAIAAGVSDPLAVTVAVAAAAVPSVTDTVRVATTGDVNLANNVASVTTTVAGTVDLAVTAASSTPFTVGATGTYTFGVSNVGSTATTGAITLTDTLPAGITYTSVAGTGWSCVAVSQVVTCTNAGPIAAGASDPLTVTVAVAAAAVPSVTDTVRVATTGDVNLANNVASTTTVVKGVVDLALAKSHSGAFTVGTPGVYTLTVSNVGSAATTGAITITDTLPTGLSYTSVAGTGWSCADVGQVVTCTDAGPIAAGAQSVVTLTVGVAAAAIPTVTNTASVSTPGDNDPGNNKAIDSPTTVNGAVDLAVTETSSPTFAVGQAGTYTIGVTDVGSAATTGAITITDTLPAGITYTSVAGTGWTCAAVGQVVTCTNAGPIAAGASDPLALTVAVAAAAVPSVTDTVRVATTGDVNLANNVASVTTSVTGTIDLAVTASGPSSFNAGQLGIYTVGVTNVGSSATTGPITITDTLPTGVTYSSVAGTGWSCAAVGQVVTCTNAGPIAAGGSDPLALTVAVSAAAIPSVTDTVRVATAGDVNLANNVASVTTTVNGALDLAVTATSSPFTVGTAGTYTFAVSNVGSAPTTAGITLTDTLPTGITYTSAAGTGWTCAVAGQVVTCTNAGPIAAGASDPVTFTVAVAAAAVPSVTDTVRVATAGDVNLANNVAAVTTTVNGTVDLALAKTHAGTFVVGNDVTYTLTVSNVGNGASTGAITLTDTLPAGVSYASASGAPWSCAVVGQVVTCTSAGPIAPGGSSAATLTVLLGAGAQPSVTNTAYVSTPGDVNLANNKSVDGPVAVGQGLDLALTKSHTGTFSVGHTGMYTLTVVNHGPGPTTGAITLTDTLPTGLTYASESGAGWTCTALGQIVTCRDATTLADGGTTTLIITVNVGAAAYPSVTNTARITTPGDTTTGGNNYAVDAPTTVTATSQLIVAKTASAQTVEIADALDYSVSIQDIGAAPATGVTVRDQLPMGFAYQSGSARVAGVKIADPTGGAGPQLTFAVGNVAAGTAVTLSYRVRVGVGAKLGPAVNTAQALVPSGSPSNVGSVTVQVVGGAFTDNGTIIGKIFVDCSCDSDRVQGPGDLGIPGVRVFLEDGTSAITDVEGKYSFFDVTPHMHVVKVDRTTLPAGAELVTTGTRNAGDPYSRFVDVTKGELIKANFAEGSGSQAVLAAVRDRRAKGQPKTMQALAFAGGPPASASPSLTLYTPTVISASSVFTGPLGADASTPTQMPSSMPLTVTLDTTTTPSATAGVATGTTAGATAVAPMPIPSAPVQTGPAPEAGTEWRSPFASLPLTSNMSNVPATSFGLPDSVMGQTPGASPLTSPNQGAVAGLRGSTVVGGAPPAPRPLVAVGMLEAHFDLQSLTGGSGVSGKPADSFMESLQDISTQGSDATFSARTAVFIKGSIRGDYFLTLGYDSEHADQSGLFRDIDPDPLFPVAGDASVTSFDAQSSQRFYGRIDKGQSFLLYGDFMTPASTDTRQLAAYNVAMTGLLDHTQNKWGSVDAYVSEGRQSQVVDEFPAEGISGPYNLSQGTNLAPNSETVELLTRDRNQPSIVLSTTTEVRYTDYTIDPITGRLLFRVPVPSLDANLNPISIRVTYQLNAAGKAFWTYGADGQVRPIKAITLGGSYIRDEDPMDPRTIGGVNASAAIGGHTVVVGEYARSDSGTGVAGNAERVEIRHADANLQFRVFGERADSTFSNPSSTFGNGEEDAGAHASYTIDPTDHILADALYVNDLRTGGTREGISAAFERVLSKHFKLSLGYRYGHETAAPAEAATATSAGETAVTPNTTNAVTTRLTATISRTASLYGEYEQDVIQGADRRLAIGGDYIFLHKIRVYAEHEFLTSLAGPYTLNDAQQQNSTVFGVSAAVSRDATVFSEYRAADAFEGRQTEAAIGLRNKWTLAPGVIANTSVERVDPIGTNAEGAQPEATAITGAIEYLASPLWKGTARLETRFTTGGTDILGTLGYSRKINKDLTFLGRSIIDQEPDHLLHERTQLGLALRQTDTDRWNLLTSIEQRYDNQADTGSGFDRHTAEIAAAALNFQATRRLALSVRYAAKVDLDAAGGTTTMSTGQLFTTRAVIDLTKVWDAGVIGNTLVGQSIADRTYGVGFEVGRVIIKNLRAAVGYNILGFSDSELAASNYTTRGFYIDMSFKFDESALGWLAAPAASASAVPAMGAHR